MTLKNPAPEKRAKLPRKSDRTKQFDKDWTRLHGAGRTNLRRAKDVMLLLIADDAPLPTGCKDHALQGGWAGYRDCHAGGDLVLIYKLEVDSVIFVRIGSHAELFECEMAATRPRTIDDQFSSNPLRKISCSGNWRSTAPMSAFG